MDAPVMAVRPTSLQSEGLMALSAKAVHVWVNFMHTINAVCLFSSQSPPLYRMPIFNSILYAKV